MPEEEESIFDKKETEDKPETSVKHKLIGIAGVVLLILYVILSIWYQPFRALSARFVSLLMAVFRDFTLAFVLVPLYINWVTSDYFQERRKTSLGNAAKNGFTGIWVSIIWIRYAYVLYAQNPNSVFFIAKISLSILMFLYAFLVVKEAIQGEVIARIVGRVRQISYFAIMVTPLIFEIVPIDWVSILAIIVFFPLWHGLIEFLEYFLLPPPVSES